MSIPPPLSWLQDGLQMLNLPTTPPDWVVQEGQRRVVLLLNHVLQQEPQATERLARQRGRRVWVEWREFHFHVVITPAGLLDLANSTAPADLVLRVTETSAAALAQTLLRGEKPALRIEGDVQLAAELNWLVEYVRWDAEEDLARIVGDVPARMAAQVARSAVAALRKFARPRTEADAASTATPPAAAQPSAGKPA